MATRNGQKKVLLRSSVVIGLVALGFLLVPVAQRAVPAADAPAKPFPQAPASFTDLVERVKQGVVNISTTKVVQRRPMPSPFGPQSPFRDFFGDDFFERFFGQMPREQKQHSLGSGFIIDPAKGFIITNNHVVANADEINVRLDNGKDYEGEVVGRDPKTDLALIRTKKKMDTTASEPLGDSDKAQVGEWVMAIGNPFGLERTVTVGIISAKGRVIGAGPYDDFLQTDAAINPGNSGGPLFNMKGEVIGINTAIVASGQGIGFAIPINLAKEILPQLEKGKVIRGWLGVSIQDVTPELAKSFNLKDTKGALVADVVKDSPAQKAGIERGDIIVSFDGKAIASAHELSRTVAGTAPNTKAKVEVIRNGKRQAVTVQVGTMPGEAAEETKVVAAELGLSVQTLTPELAEQFEWPREEKGILITGVEPGSAAEDGGLRRGDLIKEMDHKPVQTLDDYRRQLNKAKQGESILFLVKRGNQTFFVTVKKGND
ncbi:MAG TPA: DegQ family serine endoprotease [Syntrophobacteria bacterium]|nr:DegQ family serine endoprotease [Syntrophobacteria bacterium]